METQKTKRKGQKEKIYIYLKWGISMNKTETGGIDEA